MNARYYNGEPEERHNPGGTPLRYHCTDCTWTGRGASALDHHRETGHTVALPNGATARFSCCAEHSHHLRRLA
jgi:hypothetical protein